VEKFGSFGKEVETLKMVAARARPTKAGAARPATVPQSSSRRVTELWIMDVSPLLKTLNGPSPA
jgi:hypothetical protein